MNDLLKTICRIGVFVICAQAVVHFRPQAAYEKYLKLLVSVMVLIQLFLPVSRILFHGNGEELEIKTQVFLEGLEAEMSAAESRAFETDALLEQMTLEEIRRRAEEAKADSGDSGTGSGRPEDSGTGSSRPEDSGTESGRTGDSVPGSGRSEDSVPGSGGPEDSGTGSSRTENSVPDNGGAEPGGDTGEQLGASGTAGSTADNDTVRIDRIQVGEIQVQLQLETGSPE